MFKWTGSTDGQGQALHCYEQINKTAFKAWWTYLMKAFSLYKPRLEESYKTFMLALFMEPKVLKQLKYV